MKTIKLPIQRLSRAVLAVVMMAVSALLLEGCGGPDKLAGYYAINVNSASDATPEKQSGNVVFGFERLVFNENHTFRLGFLRGDWNRSGDTVTLDPKSKPAADSFYTQTTMAQALSILLNKTELKISSDEKTLTAVNAPNGPVVFTKTGDVMQ